MSRGGFEYLDLIDGNSIRVVEIKPAKHFHSQIQCDLLSSPRSACRAYEALSYCWGTADQGFECIVVNRGECNVRRSLAAALRHLRLEDQTRRIWADAVCINQRCKQEKSKQVGQMDVTYGEAAKVLVWLGEELGESRIAMKAIEKIGSHYKGQTLNDVHSQELVLPEIEGCGPEVHWPAIRELLQRKWFQRLWVCMPDHLND